MKYFSEEAILNEDRTTEDERRLDVLMISENDWNIFLDISWKLGKELWRRRKS